ncbi:RtcB family protein [Ochrobactrum haematophilum]|uniref:3'-phosphate/5'-hydroxy nucleic acid ligase n=1 Tax=Brucella haematophila TaxID=419474 RepID=A0ABX1DPW5_9HYPH|nr:RtcB family protein [Brucella haematophila]
MIRRSASLALFFSCRDCAKRTRPDALPIGSHRKFSRPRRVGLCRKDQAYSSPYERFGEPVILPGSMGDSTWLLAGCGSVDFLESAAHGAGRKLSLQNRRRERIPVTTCVCLDRSIHKARLCEIGRYPWRNSCTPDEA